MPLSEIEEDRAIDRSNTIEAAAAVVQALDQSKVPARFHSTVLRVAAQLVKLRRLRVEENARNAAADVDDELLG